MFGNMVHDGQVNLRLVRQRMGDANRLLDLVGVMAGVR
uniref:Uncharacterized protein n=1 Tax=Rhodococcus ruber TaxID=1830 RepID=A0A866W099_9NOCA|nr:hypothetical protein [Rhodococcus ruber]